MPSDAGDVTLCKINAGGNSSYYVHIRWRDQGSKGFLIQATDGLQCWRGEVSSADMQAFAKKTSISLTDFAELTLRAFSQTGDCDAGPLCCYIAKTDQGLQVAWKRVLASEQIKFQLGVVLLEGCTNQGQVHLEFLGHAMTLTHELQTSCTALSVDNRRLAEERDSSVKKLEQMVAAKQQHEKILFQNFVAVLNAKKEKLRQLAEIRTATTAQKTNDKGVIAASADVKVTSKAGAQPSSGVSSDDTEVDEDVNTGEAPSAANVVGKTQALNDSLLSNDDSIPAVQPVRAYRRRAYRMDTNKPGGLGSRIQPSVTASPAKLARHDVPASSQQVPSDSQVNTADLIDDL